VFVKKMGGKGRKNNKLYLTQKEWKEEFGGKRGDELVRKARVPFECCALSLQPFRDPVMAPDGSIFDILHVLF
jgi:peptidyl-prolyl cis-trans isomerase-like protein 2